MILSKSINNTHAGKRLDVVLTEMFTYRTRNGWQKLIDDGSVLLNGKRSKPSIRLPRDSSITYDIGEYEEKPVDINYSVLYEDDHLLMINKPPNIPVHTSGKYFNNTLIKLLRADYPNLELNLINRLDRETSGVICLGKTFQGRQQLGNQFRDKLVRKTYITYCFGVIPEEIFTVNAPIAEDVSRVVRIRMGVDEERGLPAETHFSVVKRTDRFTKLLCHPITGRTNQIRVHLFHYGYPIIGDKLYSGDDNDFLEFVENGNTPRLLEKLLMPRQALHAHKIEFTHPVTGVPMSVTAEEPEDMKAFERKYLV